MRCVPAVVRPQPDAKFEDADRIDILLVPVDAVLTRLWNNPTGWIGLASGPRTLSG